MCCADSSWLQGAVGTSSYPGLCPTPLEKVLTASALFTPCPPTLSLSVVTEVSVILMLLKETLCRVFRKGRLSSPLPGAPGASRDAGVEGGSTQRCSLTGAEEELLQAPHASRAAAGASPETVLKSSSHLSTRLKICRNLGHPRSRNEAHSSCEGERATGPCCEGA